jgi:hypothetical protein
VIEYKVSSFCSLGNCVEIGRTPDGGVALRDSKNPQQGPLVFTSDEWSQLGQPACSAALSSSCSHRQVFHRRDSRRSRSIWSRFRPIAMPIVMAMMSRSSSAHMINVNIRGSLDLYSPY